MMRRTPMEVYIHSQTDRQAAYEKRRRDKGETRVAVWVDQQDVEALKLIVQAMVEARDVVRAVEPVSGQIAEYSAGKAWSAKLYEKGSPMGWIRLEIGLSSDPATPVR